MKSITGFLAITAFLFAATVNAQKIKTKDGDLSVLKNETEINIEFVYDGMAVGKFKTEKEYVDSKVAEYNKKEAGKGDTWAKNWVTDRENKYEPKFTELFTLTSGMKISKTAKYTLIFKTIFIEPGYNVAGGFSSLGRKNASVDAEVWIVETANKDKKTATLSVDNAPGGGAFGFDFDSGFRISEAYAISGRKLGNYIK